MDASSTSDWKVEFPPPGGPGGFVGYYEGPRAASFWWDYAGYGVILTVRIGTISEWRKQYPWAADRRAQIVDRIAQALIREHANSYKAKVEERDGVMYLDIYDPSEPKVPTPEEEFARARAKYLADGSFTTSESSEPGRHSVVTAPQERMPGRETPLQRMMQAICRIFR